MEATPAKRDMVFDFFSHNPKVWFSRKIRSQLGIIVRISRRPNARKRHQNKHLILDRSALQAGGPGFESRHVHQLNSRSPNRLRCFLSCTILLQFRDNRYSRANIRSRKSESVAHSFCFIEA